MAIVAEKFGPSPSEQLGILDEVIAKDFNKAAALCLRDSELEMWKVEQELETERTKAITGTLKAIAEGFGITFEGSTNSEPTIYGKPISSYSDEEIAHFQDNPKQMGHARVVNGELLDGVNERALEQIAEEKVRKELKLGQKPYGEMSHQEQMKFSAMHARATEDEIQRFMAIPKDKRPDVGIAKWGNSSSAEEALRQYEEAKKITWPVRDTQGNDTGFRTSPSPRIIGASPLEFTDPDVV